MTVLKGRRLGVFVSAMLGAGAALGCQLVSAQTVFAGDATWATKIDTAILDAKTRAEMSSGTAYLVVKEDKVVHEGFFGFSDVEGRKRVDENTVFYIASTTKAYFSLATLLAEHRGDLTENTSLSELFPEVGFDGFDPSKVTVRHLLTHTHGLSNEHMTWAGSYSGIHDAALRRKMLAATTAHPESKLGDFNYTNLGYNILSIWYEDRYGRDWRDTMRDTLLTPMGMTHTTGYMSEAHDKGWDVAKPYTYKVDRGQKAVYLQKDDKTMFAIGLVSTPRDVAKLLMAELNEGRVAARQALPPGAILKSQKKQVSKEPTYYDGYAWGWFTGTRAGERVNFHTGGFVGASALISYMPEEDIGLVILHNEGGLRANYLSSLIEQSVYGSLAGDADFDLEATLAAETEDMVAAYQKAIKRLDQRRQTLESAKWQLTHEMHRYAGRYHHPLSGEIFVARNGAGGLSLTWGNLKGPAYPGGTDAIKAELRPGSFDSFTFMVGENGVSAIVFNDIVFTKRN